MAQAAGVAGRITAKKKRRSFGQILREMRREWTAYLFQAPGLILFFVFTVYAIVVSFMLAFSEWDIIGTQGPKFVGLDNFRDVAQDAEFANAIKNTVIYTIGSIPLTMAFGLALALLLNTQIRGLGLFRTAYYLPVITPLVVAAIVWKWVYNADYGLANYYLQKMHLIDQPLLWLSSRNLAMPAVILMSVWKSAGFAMVVYLAGLQAIPGELYEAAEVDGAGVWSKFRRITFPLLAPTTLFLLVISIIGSMQVFTQIFIMTNGGPPTANGGKTTTIIYYIYQQAFKFFKMGYASALSYALFAMILVFSLIQFRIYAKRAEI